MNQPPYAEQASNTYSNELPSFIQYFFGPHTHYNGSVTRLGDFLKFSATKFQAKK